jgi:hypothetical protein
VSLVCAINEEILFAVFLQVIDLLATMN